MQSKSRKLDRLCGATGNLTYLKLICLTAYDTSTPSGKYIWTNSRNTTDVDDNSDYAQSQTEGIDVKNNTLYFVTKSQERLYTVNLGGKNWTSSATIESDDCAAFTPYQVAHITGSDSPDDLLYFTEDGDGTQDIHARGTNTNGDYKFFTIIQGYSSTETVGLTFSLDNKYMYFAHQKNSEIWQIWRDDGCSFGNGIYMDVNYHETIARY